MRLLTREEACKAASFRFEADRQRYAIAHAALREILPRKLRTLPEGICFDIGSFGKPSTPGLEFNLSHSGNLALVAIGNVPLGVDIERIEALDAFELAGHHFSTAEVLALRSLPPDAVLDGFFACWTRKEAFVKATGEGLARPLHQFDVSVGRTAALLVTRPDSSEAGRWVLQRLDVGAGYAASLCVRGSVAASVTLIAFNL
jgi:4'-phosphopantetheinyl transferase